MIRINSLRIGNFVSIKTEKYKVDVAKVYHLETGRMSNYPFSYNNIGCTFANCMAGHNDIRNIYDISSINPIPLTEEILLNCGFEKHSRDGRVYYGRTGFFHLHLFNESGSISYECRDNIEGNYIHLRVDSLHQLQNLYYAVTGMELRVRL